MRFIILAYNCRYMKPEEVEALKEELMIKEKCLTLGRVDEMDLQVGPPSVLRDVGKPPGGLSLRLSLMACSCPRWLA